MITKIPYLPIKHLGKRSHRPFKNGSAQDGGLPVLLLAYSCLTNHSKAASLWLATPKQDVGDHQWRVVCCNVECLNFGTQNLRPSNVKVIFQRSFCGYPYSGGFRFQIAGTRDGTASHFVTQRPSDPGIERRGDSVDPVTLFYNELHMSTYVWRSLLRPKNF